MLDDSPYVLPGPSKCGLPSNTMALVINMMDCPYNTIWA